MTTEALTSKKNEPLKLAVDWLANSAIQNSSVNKNLRGGVHAWFDRQKGKYAFLYSEIAGYAINTFLFFNDLHENDHYLKKAKLAADWLLKIASDESGCVKTRMGCDFETESYFDSWTFTFDNWMVLYALCNLYGVTHEKVYLENAKKLGNFLTDHTVRPDGLLMPIFNVKDNKTESPDDKWSRQSGSFHAKALLGLLRLHELTQSDRLLQCAERLARAVLALQEADGRFVTQTNNDSTLLHPHLYTLEGLLFYGVRQDKPEYIEAVVKGLTWAFHSQGEDGALLCYYDNNRFLPFVRVDVLAQALRIGSLLMQIGRSANDLPNRLSRLRTKLISFQIKTGSQRGGFLYGQEENGVVHDHVNAWVTMFAVQALQLYDAATSKQPAYRFNFFV